MSKGKHERKRKRAIEKANRQAEQIRLTHDVVIPTENQPEKPTSPGGHRNQKEKRNMGFGEVIKRSSPSDWCLVIFTGALVALGYFQFKTMDSQLFVMRNDERAWLDLRMTSDPPTASFGETLKFPLKVINTGKTPARNVKLAMNIQFLRAGDPVDFGCVNRKHNCMASVDVWGILSAGGDTNVLATSEEMSGQKILVTQEEASEWQEEKAYIAVVGLLVYQDVYGTNHWVHFCTWENYIPNGGSTHFNAESCTEYNSVDSN